MIFKEFYEKHFSLDHSDIRNNQNIPALPCNVAKVNTIHDKSFKVIGPRLWNTLPKAINTQDTLSGFKSSLDTYLLNIQDCPPVAGYSRANDNSLLSRIQWLILFVMIYRMLFHICYLWSTICRQGGLISNQLTRFSFLNQTMIG